MTKSALLSHRSPQNDSPILRIPQIESDSHDRIEIHAYNRSLSGRSCEVVHFSQKGETQGMRCCKSLVRVWLFLLAVVPAYCQRGTFGIDIGNTSDTFAGLPT